MTTRLSTNKIFVPAVLIIFSLVSFGLIQSLAPQLLIKHSITYLAATVIFLISKAVPFAFYQKHWQKIYWLCIGLLVLPFALGHEVRETARWIYLGDWFVLQPSQLAFPLIGLALVTFVTNQSLKKLTNQLKAGGLILLPTLIIAAAPNLSSAVFFFILMIGVLYLAGLPNRNFFVASLIFIAIFGLSWQNILRSYQKTRLLSFFSQDLDTQSNYNARQALIAVGSGGLWGQGFAGGTQANLYFLPEKQTDFVFAAFCEQFGLTGGILLILTYASLVGFIIKTSFKSKDNSEQLYLGFIGFFLSLQTFIAIGTNIGLLPITGLTLPFVSTGGSSLISFALAMGLAQGIINRLSWEKTTLLV